jgi:hypothetical protein
MDIHTIQPQNPNLIETTTPVQARRGNRQFFCQKHKVSYITYANGYVRREINAEYTNPIYKIFPPAEGAPIVYKLQDQFVLNRRKSIPTPWGFNSRKVIKEPCAQARMDMIDRISANYKGYTGRFTQPGHTLIMK